MDAMQQWALASGIAVGGGLLGAAVSRLLLQHRLKRDVQAIASAIEHDAPLPDDPAAMLSPLQHAIERRMQAGRDSIDQAQARERTQSAELLQLMQQADGAARAKERFLSAISHDLRQPLQTIELAMARLPRSADATAALDGLQTGVLAMTRILDGLLLLSRLDADPIAATPVACDLQALLADVQAAHATRAAQAGVMLAIRAGKLAVHADPALLADLLGRLVENAIAATPDGGRVMLAARARAGRIRIEVRDNGIGIAPIHQPRVFDAFFQVGNPERDQRKGLGLGLTIASRLATTLGTRVELCSRLHGGSRFWIDLPRALPGRQPAQALLLSTTPTQTTEITAILQGWGYQVDTTGTAGNAHVLLYWVDADSDAGWNAFAQHCACHPQAVRIAIADTANAALLEQAHRHGASLLLMPVAPAKLRALLAQRPSSA
ncbi:MAG: HAMP domain-containing sensor histidine kinase [Thermomonas sp.]|uniref:sensor histidine kinase n=1 Tax=Thermomonas sp. TaxID=1971895 RepID=UPI0039E56BFC